MRAAVMRHNQLRVEDLPIPTPGPGEVLVKTLACGICGSDLHALKHTRELVEGAQRSGGPFIMDLEREVVMGHEFCAEIVDYGADTPRQFASGTRKCAMPVVICGPRLETIGYSNNYSGGYGEYMRLGARFLLPVPNGLATEHAALTEPCCVAYNAVIHNARIRPGDRVIVLGPGPIGILCAAMARLAGAEVALVGLERDRRRHHPHLRRHPVSACRADDHRRGDWRVRPARRRRHGSRGAALGAAITARSLSRKVG